MDHHTQGPRDFSLPCLQTSPWVHLLFSCYRISLPEIKLPYHEADHAPSSDGEVRNYVHLYSTPPCAFTSWFIKHEGKFLYHYFISFSSPCNDRSSASSKTIPPHSAIESLLLQMTVSSPFPKGHPATSYVFCLFFLSLPSLPLSFLQ